jgi:hypothetical protein
MQPNFDWPNECTHSDIELNSHTKQGNQIFPSFSFLGCQVVKEFENSTKVVIVKAFEMFVIFAFVAILHDLE